MTRRVLAVLPILALAYEKPAGACSIVGPSFLDMTSGEAATKLAPPAILGVRVRSAVESPSFDCGGGSCSDVHSVDIEVDPSGIDEARTGFRVALVRGAVPFTLPTEPQLLVSGDGSRRFLQFVWAGDAAPPDATIRITAVDAAGNAAAPVDVEVVDSSSGCAVVPAGWLVVLLTAALRRRSRR